MKLQPEYETVRSNLMSCASLPNVDDCLQELLREEQRLVSKLAIEQQSSTEAPLTYAAKTRPPPRDITKVQCYNCKKYGHYANQCKLKVCKYCKAVGHVIEVCRKKALHYASHPYVQSASSAYTATTPQYASSEFSGSLPFDSSSQPGSSSQTQSPALLTPAMVNQMIINALSSMHISGTGPSLSNTWYLDSGASNHMTSSPSKLYHVVPYTGTFSVQAANGDHPPIVSVGDAPGPFPLTNVFVSPYLATNLVSVGQLVENNYEVSFSSSGCLVQDQESGAVIARGPKRGRLFTLPVSTFIQNKHWHQLFCFLT